MNRSGVQRDDEQDWFHWLMQSSSSESLAERHPRERMRGTVVVPAVPDQPRHGTKHRCHYRAKVRKLRQAIREQERSLQQEVRRREELEAAVRRQNAELARLREENEQMEQQQTVAERRLREAVDAREDLRQRWDAHCQAAVQKAEENAARVIASKERDWMYLEQSLRRELMGTRELLRTTEVLASSGWKMSGLVSGPAVSATSATASPSDNGPTPAEGVGTPSGDAPEPLDSGTWVACRPSGSDSRTAKQRRRSSIQVELERIRDDSQSQPPWVVRNGRLWASPGVGYA